MDGVRKSERRIHKALKGHKYTFSKKADKLSKKQKHAKDDLIEEAFPTLGKTIYLQELFDDFFGIL